MSGGEQQRPARSAEHARLAEASSDAGGDWKFIGPYLAERAWGTVREDYSADGDAPEQGTDSIVPEFPRREADDRDT